MKPIDGDDMLRRVNFLLATIYTPEFVEILTALKEYLEKAPALALGDLRPKGRWNIVEIDKATNRITIECTECGMVEEVAFTTYGLWRDFCPNCGADMRGGGEDA